VHFLGDTPHGVFLKPAAEVSVDLVDDAKLLLRQCRSQTAVVLLDLLFVAEAHDNDAVVAALQAGAKS
jgi:hypothetical protein